VQQQALAIRCRIERLGDRTARLGGKLLQSAEQADANALPTQFVGLAADRGFQQAEEATDLIVRSRPVLATEGVQREYRHATSDGVAEDLADGLDPRRVAVELRKALLARPAAIAVHDDRDVTRQLVERQERTLVGALGGHGGR